MEESKEKPWIAMSCPRPSGGWVFLLEQAVFALQVSQGVTAFISSLPTVGGRVENHEWDSGLGTVWSMDPVLLEL